MWTQLSDRKRVCLKCVGDHFCSRVSLSVHDGQTSQILGMNECINELVYSFFQPTLLHSVPFNGTYCAVSAGASKICEIFQIKKWANKLKPLGIQQVEGNHLEYILTSWVLFFSESMIPWLCLYSSCLFFNSERNVRSMKFLIDYCEGGINFTSIFY